LQLADEVSSFEEAIAHPQTRAYTHTEAIVLVCLSVCLSYSCLLTASVGIDQAAGDAPISTAQARFVVFDDRPPARYNPAPR